MLERSVRFVILWFILHISNIRLVKSLYIRAEVIPGIFTANKFQYFILTKIANKNMIIIILENICMEITNR